MMARNDGGSHLTRSQRGLALILAAFVLIATGCQGGSGTTDPNQTPTAVATATPTTGRAPLTVVFDGSASSGNGRSLVARTWDFGDGASGSGAVTTHEYTIPGRYTARHIVSDDRGTSASASVVVEVTEAVTTGTITGALVHGASPPEAARTADTVGGDSIVALTPLAAPAARLDHDAVPGELIVGFRPSMVPLAHGPLHVADQRLDVLRSLAIEGARLYRHTLTDPEHIGALITALTARPDVAYAHPNYRRHAFRVPNDELYGLQWHYQAIDLPQAWDITTGSTSVIVAVGDSGILVDPTDPSRTHPDLAARTLPGYDFISDPTMAGDGDGRDPDPYDEGGDFPDGSSSYHGTHVAGTIGASTDNTIGVAGVDWNARILPVRMLGRGGGTIVDIVEGSLWAAGFSVPGVPDNPTPAHVINLSLGGPGLCSPFEQQAFDRIAASAPNHAVVVVAAGNENMPAAEFSPASCRNVITVGATEFRGFRAPYSNHGSRIDVMAPGGDVSVDRSGDGFPDGVLSTWFDEATGEIYGFQQGTSMAAPHVAGIVALMKSLDPDLDTATTLTLLASTATPLDDTGCGRPSGSDCGAGLVNARAVIDAQRSGVVPVPGDATLSFSSNPLDFAASASELGFSVTNTAAEAVDWQILGYDEDVANPAQLPAGSIYLPTGVEAAGTLGAGSTITLGVGIDRELTASLPSGLYQLGLVFAAAGREQALTVRFAVDVGAATLQGPMLVAAFIEDADGELVLSGFTSAPTALTAYELTALAGANVVVAWSDENDNGEIDAGDYVGVHPNPVVVAAGGAITGVDVVLDRVLTTGYRPAGATDSDRLTSLLERLAAEAGAQ